MENQLQRHNPNGPDAAGRPRGAERQTPKPELLRVPYAERESRGSDEGPLHTDPGKPESTDPTKTHPRQSDAGNTNLAISLTNLRQREGGSAGLVGPVGIATPSPLLIQADHDGSGVASSGQGSKPPAPPFQTRGEGDGSPRPGLITPAPLASFGLPIEELEEFHAAGGISDAKMEKFRFTDSIMQQNGWTIEDVLQGATKA